MKNVRLSKNIVPIEYDLELKPDLENFTFSGMETINLNLLKPTKIITLHCKEIQIETADINKVFANITYDEKSETASFLFKKIIPSGKAKLNLVFKGILNDKMRGFYRSKYTVDGKEHHMATTQFEATDARRAFPCFDEPAHKAVFHVSLIVPRGKTAISNTLPVSVKEHEGEYELVKFLPTPKMSTYLLAFLVGDFEYVEKTTPTTRIRVYTTPGKKHQAKFALDCAVKTLEFYEKYFDIAYPLPVLDMIAIPDFSSLAMENWGAITYREIGLLVDEKNTSASSKEMVAEVIAHELAHQWFGNLVTMEWWTHLWLNEGFASYIAYLAMDKLFPKWNIWTQFSIDTLGPALRLDALNSTHPIEVEVHHPDEIGEIFDEVSYSKGASVIRMLAGYLGERDFRDGLRYYLKKHSYKNTETVHLWQAFAKVSKKPVAKMMRNWTGQPGYPVVKAEMVNNQLVLSQQRFFSSPISKKKSKDKTIWKIPVSIKTSKFVAGVLFRKPCAGWRAKQFAGKALPDRLLYKKYAKKEFGVDWLKVNPGETGFYRTAYSKELLEKLREPIKNKKLGAEDRLGIIRDLFALSEAGIIPTTDALGFLSAYKNENEYIVLVELASGMARLEQLLAKSPAKSNLDKIVIELFSPVFKKLGWNKKENENHTDTLLRSLVISRLGHAGDKKIIAEAKNKFKKGQVYPDIRGAVYSIIASSGGVKEYQIFTARYKKESLHEEKNRLGYALGDFRDPKILKLVCDFSLSAHVRPQDSVGILSGVGANPLGRDIWWNFVQKNWQTLVSRYGEGGLTLARAVKALSGSAEAKHFHSFKKFFKTHPAPGAARAIDQVLEKLESNIAWLARDGKKIEEFLKKY